MEINYFYQEMIQENLLFTASKKLLNLAVLHDGSNNVVYKVCCKLRKH